jgi:peptidoglycan/LPS O-acetylase OafA/YrhL
MINRAGDDVSGVRIIAGNSELGKHTAGGAAFVSNIALWSEAGYFDVESALKPFLHLWSLGIEEQFYILWPLLLGLVWRRQLNFLLVTVLVAVGSFATNVYWMEQAPTSAFYLPFSRMWELMIGGILAYLVLHRSHYLARNRRLLSIISALGLGLILLSIAFFDKFTPFPGWWALLPTIGTFLVIAGRRDGWVNRYLLGNRFAVWVGLISYPLYLWHWPLFSFAHIIEGQTPDRSIRLAVVAASVLLAWLTFEAVEKRFRRGYTRTSIAILSISMTALFATGLLIWNGTVTARHSSPEIERVMRAVGDWDYPGVMSLVEDGTASTYVKPASDRTTFFLGDSRIEQYAPRIVRLLDNDPSLNSAVFTTGGGCPPVPGVREDRHPWCRSMWQAANRLLERKDVKTVVVGGAWNYYFIDLAHSDPDLNPSNYAYYVRDAARGRQDFTGGDGIQLALESLERYLAKLAESRRVFLLLDIPSGPAFSPTSLIEGSRLSEIKVAMQPGQATFSPNRADQQELRRRMIELAVRSGVEVIDPTTALCSNPGCLVSNGDGEPVYKDHGHIRPFFIAERATFIDRVMR